eukprot:COSAG06_NODE_59281_length_274_cov_1.485714_1_plen_30_part_01
MDPDYVKTHIYWYLHLNLECVRTIYGAGTC